MLLLAWRLERHYVLSTVDLCHFLPDLARDTYHALFDLVHLLGTRDDVIGECMIMHGIE